MGFPRNTPALHYRTQLPQYPLPHFLRLLQHLVVPKPQHTESRRRQLFSSYSIEFRLLSVLSAVYFDHKSCIEANKVKNEIFEGVLSTEFVTIELFATQERPHATLGIGEIASKVALMLCIERGFVGLAVHDGNEIRVLAMERAVVWRGNPSPLEGREVLLAKGSTS